MDDIVSIDNSLLISLVEKYPVLWDRSLDFYKNRAATQAAWNQVTTTLKPEYTTWDDVNRKAYDKLIKQRWTHIRDNYYRSHKKIQEHQYYGTKPTKPYVYSKKLAFLEKVLPKFVPSLTSEEDIKTEIEVYPESIGISENSLEAHDMSAMNPTVEVIPTYSENLNDPISSQEPSETNRHLLFFKGILPSLENFDDNETIDFQMGVLKLLKKIKSGQQSERMSYKIKYEDTSSNSSGQ
ncbi:hypothetical protein PYW07_002983 [Mythimna separata]|uniref:MADF domain-containing protein n=1 Tax=Mythimna separata TaxID=271217 RepID=A0AAD8DR30_MYTSE|nr:hypothetical protein PYW07_002983 [Mythimna separata]